MSRDEALARQRQLAEVAAGDGLDIRADLARGGNTFDAHRLVQLAKANGVQDAMKERLMRAYHTEGETIGDTDTLRASRSRSACPRTRCATCWPPTATRPTSARTSARP